MNEKKLNKELAEKGYITLHGKTSRQYFYERLGLNAQEVCYDTGRV